MDDCHFCPPKKYKHTTQLIRCLEAMALGIPIFV